MEQIEFEERLHHNLDTIWDIALFNYALLFITSFLVFGVVSVLLGFLVYYGAIPAVILVSTIFLRRRRVENHIRTVEKGNPILEERLSAAYDNIENDNFIVRGLVREVCSDLNKVKTDSFLNMSKIKRYVGISIICVFILLFLLLSGYEGLGLGGFLGSGSGGDGGGNQGTGSGSGAGGGGMGEEGDSPTTQQTSIGQGPPQDIYGDSSIAQIEGDELELEMHPEYGEGGDFDFEDDERRGNIENIVNGFTQATVAETYSENIPVEMENVVRNYFEKLAEE